MYFYCLLCVAGYIQESGRAGRDGEHAVATIYCNASDLAPNVTHLSDEMRDYCKTTRCRRELLMDHFGFPVEVIEPKHTCCDNCEKLCKCEDCQIFQEQDTEDTLHLHLEYTCTITEPNESAIDTVRFTLEHYFRSENSLVDEPLPEVVTGLCSTLAQDLAKEYVNMTDVQTLQKYFHIKDIYAHNIICIIKHVHSQYHQ